jgi:hypothetical protein
MGRVLHIGDSKFKTSGVGEDESGSNIPLNLILSSTGERKLTSKIIFELKWNR